jgi:prepilin-type N-terminal cleavage/methylation domain-containing protein
MRFDRTGSTDRPRPGRHGFTLAEVLAALVLMAIVVTVTLEGVAVASRTEVLGQRKAAAARVAERVLDEFLVLGDTAQSTASGTIIEQDVTFNWHLQATNWTEDAMTMLTVQVTFNVQGNDYDVTVSTLFDPTAGRGTADDLALTTGTAMQP